MRPKELNLAIARACGLSTDRLISVDLEIRSGRWPVVRALYVPEDGGELIRILASLEAHEDITHVEIPDPAPKAPHG